MAGAVWALGAALAFSLGQIAIARGVGHLGVLLGTTVMLVAGTVTTVVAAAVIEGWQPLATATGAAILYFVGAGLLHFVGGWGFMNASTHLVGASRMSAMTGITPMFAALLAVALLGETVDPLIGVGIVLVVIGTVLVTRS